MPLPYEKQQRGVVFFPLTYLSCSLFTNFTLEILHLTLKGLLCYGLKGFAIWVSTFFSFWQLGISCYEHLAQYLFEYLLSFLLGIHPEVGLLGPRVSFLGFFLNNIVFHRDYCFIFPPTIHKVSSSVQPCCFLIFR
jgi:hypothetical protein